MPTRNVRDRGNWKFGARRVAVLTAVLAAGLAACGSTDPSSSAPVSLRIGYFPNITHVPAIMGVANGTYANDLKPDTLATPQVFSAGPAENQALLSGSIDIAFEGPSSALSAYSSSHAVTVVAGAASGGAGLVTKPSITSAAQLRGTTLGSPQLANTQDVALRYWLKTQGLTATTTGGGDVNVQPSSTGNGTVVTEFKEGKIDGAWVPEPYLSEMVGDGGHLLVDEGSLWPQGQWATTSVVVRNDFLKAHPATVKRFLTGLVDTINAINQNPAAAQSTTNQALASLQGGKPLTPSVLSSAFSHLTFSWDPLVSSYAAQVTHGEAVGLLKNPGSTATLFNVSTLNSVLSAQGKPAVKGS